MRNFWPAAAESTQECARTKTCDTIQRAFCYSLVNIISLCTKLGSTYNCNREEKTTRLAGYVERTHFIHVRYLHLFKGRSHTTSALRGEGADNSTDRLHDWDGDKEGGGAKISNFCGRHM